MLTWTGITPTPGSYAIERAIGAVGSEGLYQPLAFVPGSSSSFVDTTVQGGLTYTYRVIAATDAAGRCQALVRSGGRQRHRDRELYLETSLRRRDQREQHQRPYLRYHGELVARQFELSAQLSPEV